MDPKAPKKPNSAFVSFSIKERPKVKSEFPEIDVKTTNHVLRERWSVLPYDRKEIYEAKYRVDKTNYHMALAKHQDGIPTNSLDNTVDVNQKPKKIAAKSTKDTANITKVDKANYNMALAKHQAGFSTNFLDNTVGVNQKPKKTAAKSTKDTANITKVDKANYNMALAKHQAGISTNSLDNAVCVNQKPKKTATKSIKDAANVTKAKHQTVSSERKQDSSAVSTKAKGMSNSIKLKNVTVHGDVSINIVEDKKFPAKVQKDKVSATKKPPVVKKPGGKEKVQKGKAINLKNTGKVKKVEATKRKIEKIHFDKGKNNDANNNDDKLKAARRALECPICLESMKPPKKIWMCPRSHAICEACKILLEGKPCPTCTSGRVNLRAYTTEKMAEIVFNQSEV